MIINNGQTHSLVFVGFVHAGCTKTQN